VSDTSKFIYTSSTFKATSVNGPAVYYLGIVDFLQDWTTKKKIERLFKIYIGRKDPDGLSVMEPIGYMTRFQNKMEQVFDTEPSLKVDITGLNEGQCVSKIRLDDDTIRPYKRVADKFSYSVLGDETVNPIIAYDSPNESVLNISYESPPPRKNLSGARSVTGSAGYGDDIGSNDGDEMLRRGLHPVKITDPYQYVYDNLTSNKNTSPPSSPQDIHGYNKVQVPVQKAIVKPEPQRYEDFNEYEEL
jgi:Phosphatidylinositol-4-phosphate 5-Kinase